MSVIDAIAASLGAAEQAALTRTTGPAVARAAGPAAKTILQLNQFPMTLDPAIYENAFSNTNPSGNRKSLFAFRELADPVPTFSRTYAPSANSIENVYETLLIGAAVDGDSAFAAGVLNEARERFESEKQAYLDGGLGSWRPVYAVPADWCTAGPDRFKSLKIELSDLASPNSTFGTIGGKESLELRLSGSAPAGLSSETKLDSIQMEYLLVGLRRPWLTPMLFETSDWYLSGQDAGFCSSGSMTENNGVLPLIPTGLLLGRNVNLSGQWSKTDAALINNAASAGTTVSLGPFMLSAPGESNSSLQVIGWTSELVPFSPRITSQSAGSIHVENSGGFVARFSVEWNEGNNRRSQSSSNFPVLAAKEIGIPVNSTKIVVKIEIMTAPRPFETWKTVATYQFDKPIVKKYRLSGITLNPQVKET
jgi:hypothetical protein